MRMVFRVLVALTFAAIAFAIGLYLPLSVSWFLHGDPGMPGGAALVIIGFPLGLIGAVSAGVFTFVKLRGMTYLLKLSIVTVWSLGAMQSFQWWHAVNCYDCSLKYGFPFAFRQTEGYATGPRFLWAGLVGDLAIAVVVAAAFMWTVQLTRQNKNSPQLHKPD